ncbi:MAG: hypothetical protein WCD79_03985 [Chthoniobacteraceae bacterium]
MITTPVLHIIFYLAVLFMPAGTTKFTISSGFEAGTTWIHQADGWHATTRAGKDAGIWTGSGLSVFVKKSTATSETDMSKFLKVDTGEDQSLQVSVGERPVNTEAAKSRITFSQEPGGLFAKPVVITYSPN